MTPADETARPVPRPGGGGRVASALAALNARHPWSHNDHFHAWILRTLPARREAALDIGCGEGALVAALAAHFETVHGTDADAGMRAAARARCAGLSNVVIDDAQLEGLSGPVDLVTMIAVLHHLDAPSALREVERILRPCGSLLIVGLARSDSLADRLWDLWSAVTNPVIDLVKHPRAARGERPEDPFPVRDPDLSIRQLRALAVELLPGARIRRRVGFRYTLEWTKPARI